MTDELRFRALDHAFRVKAAEPAVRGHLDRLLGQFRAPDVNGASPVYELRRERRYHVVELDGRNVNRATTSIPAIDYVVWKAGQEAMASSRYLVVHAGAVAGRDHGVLMPATADSGKTTLTAALTRAGFDYLSDEAGVIDLAWGTLRPFARALWMEVGSIDRIPGLWDRLPRDVRERRRQSHVAPDEIRPGSIGVPSPIRTVIFPSYRTGRDVRLEPVGGAEALLMLARNAFNLDRFGGAALEPLARIVTGARCFRLEMGDLDDAVAAVRDVVEAM